MRTLPDLLKVVADDLAFLKTEWTEGVEESFLRRESVVLRRLLVDNMLQRAWRSAGFPSEPQVTTFTLSHILAIVPEKAIYFAAPPAGGFQGVALQTVVLEDGVLGPDEIPLAQQEVVGLRKFIESPCMVLKGILITRRTLVQYVANKLGGAHYDPSRENLVFALLDHPGHHLALGQHPDTRNLVYLQLLGIGQALGRSEDISRFLERASCA